MRFLSRVLLFGFLVLALAGCFRSDATSDLVPTSTPPGGIAIQPTQAMPATQPSTLQPPTQAPATVELTQVTQVVLPTNPLSATQPPTFPPPTFPLATQPPTFPPPATSTPLIPPTSAQPTNFVPTNSPFTFTPPPTFVPPTNIPPTNIPPTQIPPTIIPPTPIPPTFPPATSPTPFVPNGGASPTQLAPTETPAGITLVPTLALQGSGVPSETQTPPGTSVATLFTTPTPTISATMDGATGILDSDCNYHVEQDDRLIRIALRFHRTVDELQAANPTIINIQLIYLGELIKIPDCQIR